MTQQSSITTIVDEHDARRIANVHPPDWVNPVPSGRYHLVVIGAGTAGLVTAAAAAGLGAHVALIERHLMGGDCLNVGCVPSKALLAGARTGNAEFRAVMSRMRRLRADLSSIDSAARFRELGVDVFLGAAAFEGPDRISVGGQSLRFRRAVIATGARPATPPIPGLDQVPHLTNETIFDLTEAPARLLVIGGGPIGCELAQAMARLGTAVTILDRETRLIPHDDADAAEVLAGALRRDGITLELGVSIDGVSGGDGVTVAFHRNGTSGTAQGDALLVAAGRAPNVEGLQLERAGVEVAEHGVKVDDHLRTTNRRVFAAGDVAARHQFTHVADFQARIVVANALFPGRQRASALVVPWCTYTDPEVAQVGLTAAAAELQGVAIDTVTVPWNDVDRAVLDGTTDGFLRLHLARGTARLIGATVVGPHAGELIAEATLAMTNGVDLGGIGGTIHPYPTLAEAYRKAADQWRRRKLTPLVRRALSFWFRITG